MIGGDQYLELMVQTDPEKYVIEGKITDMKILGIPINYKDWMINFLKIEKVLFPINP